MRVETTETPFTHVLEAGGVLRCPSRTPRATTSATTGRSKNSSREDRVIFRYCDAAGELTGEANLNGSRDHIAGICSRGRNVLGMMPHPERACEDLLGSSDGRDLFRSLAATLAAHV